jgi:hypothetical protein
VGLTATQFHAARNKDNLHNAVEAIEQLGLTKLLQVVKPWKSIEDMKKILYPKFKCPDVSQTWTRDDQFGYELVAGTHAILLEAAPKIPSWITEQKVKEATGEENVKQLFDQGYFYVLDHRQRLGSFVKHNEPGRYLVAPVVLLYHKNKTSLVPVAILLKEGEKIFTPQDKGWLVAKAWVNSADSQVHQTEVGLSD